MLWNYNDSTNRSLLSTGPGNSISALRFPVFKIAGGVTTVRSCFFTRSPWPVVSCRRTQGTGMKLGRTRVAGTTRRAHLRAYVRSREAR